MKKINRKLRSTEIDKEAKQIKQTFKYVRLIKAGKLKGRPAEEFLKEL